jgi:hypothetical protein
MVRLAQLFINLFAMEDVKKEILELVAASNEAKQVAQKMLALSEFELDELRQIMSDEPQEDPVMEEAEERNNPGPGVVGRM